MSPVQHVQWQGLPRSAPNAKSPGTSAPAGRAGMRTGNIQANRRRGSTEAQRRHDAPRLFAMNPSISGNNTRGTNHDPEGKSDESRGIDDYPIFSKMLLKPDSISQSDWNLLDELSTSGKEKLIALLQNPDLRSQIKKVTRLDSDPRFRGPSIVAMVRAQTHAGTEPLLVTIGEQGHIVTNWTPMEKPISADPYLAKLDFSDPHQIIDNVSGVLSQYIDENGSPMAKWAYQSLGQKFVNLKNQELESVEPQSPRTWVFTYKNGDVLEVVQDDGRLHLYSAERKSNQFAQVTLIYGEKRSRADQDNHAEGPLLLIDVGDDPLLTPPLFSVVDGFEGEERGSSVLLQDDYYNRDLATAPLPLRLPRP